MTIEVLLKWVHLLAVAVWTGGLITLASLVPALRRAGATREHLQAAARRFGTLSWTALAVAVATGIWQVDVIGYTWSYLAPKLWLVALAAGLALFHQLTAKRTPPAWRGALQGAILLVSILVFGEAVRLFH